MAAAPTPEFQEIPRKTGHIQVLAQPGYIFHEHKYLDSDGKTIRYRCESETQGCTACVHILNGRIIKDTPHTGEPHDSPGRVEWIMVYQQMLQESFDTLDPIKDIFERGMGRLSAEGRAAVTQKEDSVKRGCREQRNKALRQQQQQQQQQQ